MGSETVFAYTGYSASYMQNH